MPNINKYLSKNNKFLFLKHISYNPQSLFVNPCLKNGIFMLTD